jgi:peptide deformylase
MYPDPILRQPASDVAIGDAEACAILDEMANKMYEWRGAGLAAPQVGISKKMIVLDVLSPQILYQMINPRIIYTSEEMVDSSEGCLSIPLVTAKVPRHADVAVEYYDRDYRKCTIEATGLLSVCLQHEIDHLDGVLYVDKLGKYSRSRLLKKSEKLMGELNAEQKFRRSQEAAPLVNDAPGVG